MRAATPAACTWRCASTDVDAEHARLRRLGVPVGELRDQPWGGERNFYFDDPDGYTWAYSQVMS